MFSNRNIFIVTVLLLVAFMQVLYPIPSPIPTNQLFLILGAVVVLFHAKGDEFHFDMAVLAFIGAIVLSIVSNDIPALFKPWSRFAQFIFLMLAGSNMLRSKDIDRIRRQMNMGVLWSAGIIAIWSFVGYFLGFGRYIWGFIHGYMGVTPHPNFLGMYVLVAMVWFAALFFRCTDMKERIILGSLWSMSLVVLLLSASRSALACGLLGTLIIVYLRLQRSVGKIMTAAFVMAAIFFISLPVLLPYAETMMKKGEDKENIEEAFEATRGEIWELRFMEIAESPYVGVGAYSCDINLPMAYIFYDHDTGSIEQGSSFLGLLAQVGWIGFSIFLLLVVPVVWKAFRYATREQTPYAQLMFALLAAIMCHMVVEGYAITAGAVQCVIFWFVLGGAAQSDKVADYPILWEKEDPITPEEYEEWKEQQGD